MSGKRVSEMTDAEVRELARAEPAITYHDASRLGRTWLQARDRCDELALRHHLARAEASGVQPLTLTEHLEVLANGEVVARVYRHGYQIHWALKAGATWQQIAEAAGTSEAKVQQQYRDLIEGQHRLWQQQGLGMDDAEYAAALDRLQAAS